MINKLPELLQRQAERLLDEFCLAAANDKYQPRIVRFRIDGCSVFLFEVRRHRNDPDKHTEIGMARLRYTLELNQWTLHYQDDDRWKLYLNSQPTLEVGRLLQTIKEDPFGYFWQAEP